MRVTLVHGMNATPASNFHPWLKRELEARGFSVRVPELPLHSGEPLEILPLMEILHEKIGMLDHEDILLGHSLGAVLALRYLEYVELKGRPRACILVGAPWQVKTPELQTLFMTDLDFDVVPWKASEFFVVHSPDDNLVPFDHAKKWAEALKAQLVDANGNGHYMDTEYPVLLDLISDVAKQALEFAPGQSLPDELAGL
ncbi:alpha/beta fold hydrolase [Candidatus Uhrbacteria bacterium]|nr:alpha/beta fold hydrolase [Candidatus Uhrbacteria bacterium]